MSRKFARIPRSTGPVATWKPVRTRDTMPPAADKSALFQSVVDQGDHGGACVPNSGLALVEFTRTCLGLPNMGRLSRLLTYYNAMLQEAQHRSNLAFSDGVAIKSLVDSLTFQGYCAENLWPYVLSHYHVQPPSEVGNEAFHHRIPLSYPSGLPAYSSLGLTRDATGQFYDLSLFKRAIAFGHCFFFAFIVWDGLRLQNYTLTPPLPSLPVNPQMDAHAVVAVGYDDGRKAFKCRNSWGSSWGDHGHFWFPYDLMKRPDLVFDPYTIDDLLEVPKGPIL